MLRTIPTALAIVLTPALALACPAAERSCCSSGARFTWLWLLAGIAIGVASVFAERRFLRK
jgi:hypothetical protein